MWPNRKIGCMYRNYPNLGWVSRAFYFRANAAAAPAAAIVVRERMRVCVWILVGQVPRTHTRHTFSASTRTATVEIDGTIQLRCIVQFTSIRDSAAKWNTWRKILDEKQSENTRWETKKKNKPKSKYIWIINLCFHRIQKAWASLSTSSATIRCDFRCIIYRHRNKYVFFFLFVRSFDRCDKKSQRMAFTRCVPATPNRVKAKFEGNK